jgi:hypothetical protein
MHAEMRARLNPIIAACTMSRLMEPLAAASQKATIIAPAPESRSCAIGAIGLRLRQQVLSNRGHV